MTSRGEVITRSVLEAPPEAVWERIASFEGINDEFAPLMKMTAPRAVREAGLNGVVPGERLCRSWVLLLRVIPFDYDDITIVRLEPGRGFLERSTMLSQREWEHERTLEPDGAGSTTVSDRVAFVPRFGLPARVVRPVVARIFRHRHARLRKRFGGRALS
jgi:ligand-binding SRPBCC domain-containing protein